uniref:Uncharacterized protein n=1 Tax=Panagrolaimus davidi TaxID=227884 RepID=A0A914Q9N1_9BILA
MVDLSEFYHVKSLQQKCDEYLSQNEYNAENIPLFFKELLKYFKSLPLFVKAIFAAIKNNHPNFVEFEIQLIRFENPFATEEKIFKKIFHWAEHQAIAKRDELNDENFNFNDAIKSEIAPFLPYIEFRKMKLCFLHTFVVKKGFIFSYDELSDILENSKGNFKVKITNENNQILSCILPRDSNSIKDIISLKFSQAVNGFPNNWLYWEETTFKYPSIPSQLKKRDDIEWYLVYYKDGRLGIRSPSLIDEDFYLIAEMSAETSAFELSEKCVIEVE